MRLLVELPDVPPAGHAVPPAGGHLTPSHGHQTGQICIRYLSIIGDVFCDDGKQKREPLSGVRPNTNIKNELFFG